MNDLVVLLGLVQPLVSKHLRVLREVGLVEVRSEGRQRMYRLNSVPLRPIYNWAMPDDEVFGFVNDFERPVGPGAGLRPDMAGGGQGRVLQVAGDRVHRQDAAGTELRH